jgi:hypothetical protein
MVVPDVRQDAAQPGMHRFGITQLAVAVERLGKGILHQIVGERTIATPGMGEAPQTWPTVFELAFELTGAADETQKTHR